MSFKCGEEPGKGIYRCTNCGHIVRLDDNTDKLPPCPNCKKCEYSVAIT